MLWPSPVVSKPAGATRIVEVPWHVLPTSTRARRSKFHQSIEYKNLIYRETFDEYHFDQVLHNYDCTPNLLQNNNLVQKLRLKKNKLIYFFPLNFISTNHVDQHRID
jgi:hypothetical protein